MRPDHMLLRPYKPVDRFKSSVIKWQGSDFPANSLFLREAIMCIGFRINWCEHYCQSSLSLNVVKHTEIDLNGTLGNHSC